MKIVFCKTGYMKYYKGVTQKDQITNGGSWVRENKDGHEAYNFDTVYEDTNSEPILECLGFVETKSTNKKNCNQLHIERIQRGATDFLDDVLVIWCALREQNLPVVVGWYQHAEVFRHYQQMRFNNGYVQSFNAVAEKKNCVLLPPDERIEWLVPVSKKNGYGFGSSLVWYANEEEAQNYIKKLVSRIQNYQGLNYIDIDETNDPVNQKKISVFDD